MSEIEVLGMNIVRSEELQLFIPVADVGRDELKIIQISDKRRRELCNCPIL